MSFRFFSGPGVAEIRDVSFWSGFVIQWNFSFLVLVFFVGVSVGVFVLVLVFWLSESLSLWPLPAMEDSDLEKVSIKIWKDFCKVS